MFTKILLSSPQEQYNFFLENKSSIILIFNIGYVIFGFYFLTTILKIKVII